MAHDLDPELHTIPPDRREMESQPTWRRDFPIDSAMDAYVARREFTKFLGLTSLALAVGQLWIGLQNKWRRARGEWPIMAVGNLENLMVGDAMSFQYPTISDPAILLRPEADRLLAYSSQCTHLQCPVLPDIEKSQLHCPCHAGYFDMNSGRPIAGPPRRPLQRIAVEVRGGTIYATGFTETSS
jgi:Rieske Fe-S protein